MSINLNTKFHSSFNTALGYGGSIYQLDFPDSSQCNVGVIVSPGALPCGIKFEGRNTQISDLNVSLISSYYDFAKTEGSFLYGGLLDKCRSQLYNGSQSVVWTMYDFFMKNHILTVVKNDLKTYMQ